MLSAPTRWGGEHDSGLMTCVTPARAAAKEIRASRAQFTASTVFHGHGKRQIQVEKFVK